jgi:LuxR family maltose regulon positive regulatory protein
MQNSDFPFIRTKIHRPATRKQLIIRQTLVEKLTQAYNNSSQLFLISAPAGYGKSTITTQWLEYLEENFGVKTAWLSLEHDENDPKQFWFYFFSAMAAVIPIVGESYLDVISTNGKNQFQFILSDFINEIALLNEQYILVLDDLHCINNIDIHKDLAFLIEHLPINMRLLIATRVDPFFPLAKLRSKQIVYEIRLQDLRFSSHEVKCFTEKYISNEVPTEQVEKLLQVTEGWVAGLQMASLSIGKNNNLTRIINNYNSSDRHLLDFFTEEIFNKLPDSISEFLFVTSLLEQFCTELCNFILDDNKSREMIDYLENQNLFIISMDNNRTWYRFHHLFLDLLRQKSYKQYTEKEFFIYHQKAAEWLEANGLHREAIRHFFGARDYVNAHRILHLLAIDGLRKGETYSLEKWLKQFPPEWNNNHPENLVISAFLDLFTSKFDSIEPTLTKAQHRFKEINVEEEEKSLWDGRIATIRATANFNLHKLDQAVEQAELALRLSPPGINSFRSQIFLSLADVAQNKTDFDLAIRYYDDAIRESSFEDNLMISILASGLKANILAWQGNLIDSEKIFLDTYEKIPEVSRSYQVSKGLLDEGISHILMEKNQLEEAKAKAQNGLRLFELWNNNQLIVTTLLTLAEICFIKKEYQLSRDYLYQAQDILKNTIINKYHYRASSIEARLWLIQDFTDKAKESLLSSGAWIDTSQKNLNIPTFSYSSIFSYTTQIAILTKENSLSEAINLTKSLKTFVHESGMGWIELRLTFQLALLYEMMNESTAAINLLTHILGVCAPQGFMRLFLDEGKPAQKLLKKWRSANPDAEIINKYIEYIYHMDEAASPDQTEIHHLEAVSAISNRELQVLKLVAAGLPNDAIAKELIISSNTVKTHLKRIFEKLYVQNRVEAVNKARELKIL